MRDTPGRLLIVDDNKVNRLLMTRSVEQLGHTAAVADNGRIAMEMLAAEPFDLLLLDIELPEMDGFEVLEALKADPKLRDLPVIVTSSVEGLDNIVRCIELGAEDGDRVVPGGEDERARRIRGDIKERLAVLQSHAPYVAPQRHFQPGRHVEMESRAVRQIDDPLLAVHRLEPVDRVQVSPRQE